MSTSVRPLRMLLTGTLLCMCGCTSVQCDPTGYRPLADLDIGRGLRLRIRAESEWEVSRGLTYEIWKGGRRTLEPRLFRFVSPDSLQRVFAPVSGPEGTVVGIVDASRPKDLLILYAHDTGDTWGYQDSAAAGRVLYERFVRDVGDPSYVLAD